MGQWTAEFVATFGLVLTILGTARYKPQAVAASVGLYITAAYWFTSLTSESGGAKLDHGSGGIVPLRAA